MYVPELISAALIGDLRISGNDRVTNVSTARVSIQEGGIEHVFDKHRADGVWRYCYRVSMGGTSMVHAGTDPGAGASGLRIEGGLAVSLDCLLDGALYGW